MKEIRTLIYISLLLILLQLMLLLASREQSIININESFSFFFVVIVLIVKPKISVIIFLLKVLWILQLLLLFRDFIRECMYCLWLLLFLDQLLIYLIRRSFLEVIILRLMRHASKLWIYLDLLILLSRLTFLVLLRETIIRIIN